MGWIEKWFAFKYVWTIIVVSILAISIIVMAVRESRIYGKLYLWRKKRHAAKRRGK